MDDFEIFDEQGVKPEVKPTFWNSEFTVDGLRARFGDKVLVKCISELGPWADGQKLECWQDYELSIGDAIILDERRLGVILTSVDKKQETETPKPAKPAKTK